MDASYKPTATWINVAVAVVFLISPWIFSFPAGTVTVNSVIAGLLVGGMSLAALFAQRRSSDTWLSLVLLDMVLGAWVFLSPLLMHFNDADAQTLILMFGGLVVSGLAAVEVWRAVGTFVPRLTG